MTYHLIYHTNHQAAARAYSDVGLLVLKIPESDLEAIPARAWVEIGLQRLIVGHVLDFDLIIDRDFFVVRHFEKKKICAMQNSPVVSVV